MTETTNTADIDDARGYYCASCVAELVDEGIAEQSDADLLIPADAGHTCDWCGVADAVLMTPEGGE